MNVNLRDISIKLLLSLWSEPSGEFSILCDVAQSSIECILRVGPAIDNYFLIIRMDYVVTCFNALPLL